MDLNKTNQFIAWLSMFTLSWLLILERVEPNFLSLGFFAFFFAVAFFGWSMRIK